MSPILRVVGVVLQGGGHLLHRRRGFLEAGRLLLGTLAEAVVAARDLLRSTADRVGTLAHLVDDRAEALVHHTECIEHPSEFVAPRHLDAMAQLAFGDRVSDFGEVFQRDAQRTHQQRRNQRRNQEPDGERGQHRRAHRLVMLHLRLIDLLHRVALRLDQLVECVKPHHQLRTHLHLQHVAGAFVILSKRIVDVAEAAQVVRIRRAKLLVLRGDVRAHGNCGELLVEGGDVLFDLLRLGDLLLYLIGAADRPRGFAQYGEIQQRFGTQFAHQLHRRHAFLVAAAHAFVLPGHRAETDERARDQHRSEHPEHADQARPDGQIRQLRENRHGLLHVSSPCRTRCAIHAAPCRPVRLARCMQVVDRTRFAPGFAGHIDRGTKILSGWRDALVSRRT